MSPEASDLLAHCPIWQDVPKPFIPADVVAEAERCARTGEPLHSRRRTEADRDYERKERGRLKAQGMFV